MHSWQLWTHGDVLKEIHGIEPRLASWEKNTHPAQIRLRAYLGDLMTSVMPLSIEPRTLSLHLEIDVQKPERLLHHYDLENYLTPLFGRQWLDASRFVHVTACKKVGGGSSLTISTAQAQRSSMEEWEHFSCFVGSGTQLPRWKADLRTKLAATQPQVLPDGQAHVHLAWRCSPDRNWVSLWKPTGDAMGSVLGESNQNRLFSPRDDRIVSLALHRTTDASIGHDVEVGMWWRLRVYRTNRNEI